MDLHILYCLQNMTITEDLNRLKLKPYQILLCDGLYLDEIRMKNVEAVYLFVCFCFGNPGVNHVMSIIEINNTLNLIDQISLTFLC